MTRSTHTTDNRHQNQGSRRGFASMPNDKLKEIGRKGGYASQESRSRRGSLEEEEESDESSYSSSGRGFASMPKEKAQEAARKGGKQSHRQDSSYTDDE